MEMATDAPTRPSRRQTWTLGGPVVSSLPEEELTGLEERAKLAIGSPAAFSLFGFATGTWIAGIVTTGLFGGAQSFPAVVPVLVVFAGIAQFIGGLVAYRRGNTFAGTAFCSYGANNVVVATFFFLQAAKVIPAAPGSPAAEMLALELFCFALISLVFAIGALRLNVTFTLVLVALVPGFALAGIPNAAGTGVSPVIGHIGGYFLIASAALAAYAAAALVLNSVWQRRFLPLGSLA